VHAADERLRVVGLLVGDAVAFALKAIDRARGM
jgi:hypothetical protein